LGAEFRDRVADVGVVVLLVVLSGHCNPVGNKGAAPGQGARVG
jgi:hypothetical protein